MELEQNLREIIEEQLGTDCLNLEDFYLGDSRLNLVIGFIRSN